MKQYDHFSLLFADICEIKEYVIHLWGKDLKDFKKQFYQQPFPKWRLDLMWEFIWNDIDYPTMFYIFRNAKII